MCQWVITADHVRGEKEGAGNFNGDQGKLPYRFKMRNEDQLCFEGRSNEKNAFDPLDWGKGEAGCISIEYEKKH